MEVERLPEKGNNGKFHNTWPVGKPSKMGGRRVEGHITDPGNTKMEAVQKTEKNGGVF
jgi:hypothetical protein